jgi:hypothetical protein
MSRCFSLGDVHEAMYSAASGENADDALQQLQGLRKPSADTRPPAALFFGDGWVCV